MTEPQRGGAWSGEEADDDVERLFAEYLGRLADDEAADFDRFAEHHPEVEDELRRLHSDWRFFARSSLGVSVLDSLRADLGSGVDPELGGPAPGSHTQKLLDRLVDPEARSQVQVLERVGGGGQGHVYRVWDRDLRRFLALKVLTGGSSARTGVSVRQVSRFLEEAQVTGQLSHPGVVPVHGLGIDSLKRPYYTMPLIEGQDLQRVFERSWSGDDEWTTARVLGVLLRVCETMAFAHERGVVHRDLKPANVMVGGYGEVYVVDWGLAQVGGQDGHGDGPEAPLTDPREDRLESDHETEGTLFIGTPGYSAPEQFGAIEVPVDARADVWAMGAMLYALTSRSSPLAARLKGARTAEDVRAAYLAAPPELTSRKGVPPELSAITHRALAYELHDRYASMSALASDLRAFLEDRVVEAYRTGPLVELAKWVRRNRGTAAGIVATVVAVMGAFVWSSVLQARSHRELLLTSDGFVLDYLVAERERLVPLGPEIVPAISTWLRQREELMARLPAHAERASQDRREFASDREQQRAAGFVERIEATLGEETELVAGVLADLEYSRSLEERSLNAPDVAQAWSRAIEAIADETRSPAYGGLRIDPQLGLIPLEPDPASGLWEFVHVGTGEALEHDEEGRPRVTSATGLIFVLLPGGRFSMGAEPPPDQNTHDVMEREGPVHEVELAPFFLSKFEMTRAQWARARGSDGESTSPIAGVSWLASERVLYRHGLQLPTEAQWEYAARCGTSTPWWFGEDPRGLVGYVNLAGSEVPPTWPQSITWLSDGHVGPGPVDGRQPSPWGFHDVYGNVWELCADEFCDYTLPGRAGDGLRLCGSGERIARGGSHINFWKQARAAIRETRSSDFSSQSHGLRPARRLE